MLGTRMQVAIVADTHAGRGSIPEAGDSHFLVLACILVKTDKLDPTKCLFSLLEEIISISDVEQR